MRKFILTVRPEPDGALDVAALARRNVLALSAPLMAPAYLEPDIPEPSLARGAPGGAADGKGGQSGDPVIQLAACGGAYSGDGMAAGEDNAAEFA